MSTEQWSLVTGASSGLGVEYARALARSGHNLVLVARNSDRLESLAGAIGREFSVDCEVLITDLHKARDVA